ncbi:hypothetical protein CVU5213_08775, partial [Campylobacter vulpis]
MKNTKVGGIKVSGTINGNIATYSGTIGSIEIEESAVVKEGIRIGTSNWKDPGVIEGNIIVKGTLNGSISNSGTINGKIEYEGKNAVNIYNIQGGVIAQGITNKGTATIRNQGKIQN